MLYYPAGQELSMRVRRSNSVQRMGSFLLILTAFILLTIELILFSRQRANFPPQMVIGGIAVGNLDRQGSAERLLEIYSLPVELHYNDQVILVNPAIWGFELDLESMLAAADLQRTGDSFWTAFWEFLWGTPSTAHAIPLDSNYSESSLRNYLIDEISARYDQPPTIARPYPGTLRFELGNPGTTFDLDEAVFQIENAMNSPSQRVANLPLENISAVRPSFQNLQTLLQQTIDLSRFDGLAGVYLMDLQTAQEIHFLYSFGDYFPTNPDLAFTAASIIKVPIMVSAYRILDNNSSEEASRLLSEMITLSGNDPADWLMEQFIDPDRGPLVVTEDMQQLGLENTFLAGLFRPGSHLLQVINTPGNSRADLDTDPDLYNQTSLSDMGMLLADIFQCAETGGGTLRAVFPEEITQAECQNMINLMAGNNLPSLITDGIPEGTRIAHKHGWILDNLGLMTTMGDAAIVFTPTGNYVLVIFLYHPVQLIWETESVLIGDLSEAIYNFYNITSQ